MKKALKINVCSKQNDSLNVVMDRWLVNCEVRGLSSATLYNYSSTAKMFLEVTVNKSIDQLSKSDIDNFILYLRNRGNNNTSINTRLKSLTSFTKYAEIEIQLPTIRLEKNIKIPYTQDEIQQLLKEPVIQSYTQWRNHAIVSTFLGTGIRCRTLINLRIKDIDFKSEMLYLNVTKTNKKYFVPLSSELVKILKHYLSLFEHKEDDWLFMNQYGEQLTRNSLKQTIRDYNLNRGVTKTSIHLFRHTFAYNYIKSGGNVLFLQRVLGHSRTETTQLYVSIQADDLKESFDSFCILDNIKKKESSLKRGRLSYLLLYIFPIFLKHFSHISTPIHTFCHLISILMLPFSLNFVINIPLHAIRLLID